MKDLLSTDDRETIERMRGTAAWQEAERAREAERAKTHARLARERGALLAESESALGKLNGAHMEALAVVEEIAAKLAEAKAAAFDAERAAYDASFAFRRRLNLLEFDLRETAHPAIAEARAWARSAMDEARGGRRTPGQRMVTHGRNAVWVPKSDEYRAACEFVSAMAHAESGPLYELEMSDPSAGKVAERVAELRAEAERLIAAALSSDQAARGPVARLVEGAKRIMDVHETRTAGQALEAQ